MIPLKEIKKYYDIKFLKDKQSKIFLEMLPNSSTTTTVNISLTAMHLLIDS